MPCPDCGSDLVQRKARNGRTFYGCSAYPDCEWTAWTRPLSVDCPTCGCLLVAKGKTKAVCTACEAIWSTNELSESAEEGQGSEHLTSTR